MQLEETPQDDWWKALVRTHFANEREETGLRRAQAKFDHRDYTGAVSELTRFLESHEQSVSVYLLHNAHMLLAESYYELGDLERVVPELCAGIEHSRDETGGFDGQHPPDFLGGAQLFLCERPELQPRVITPQLLEFYVLMHLDRTKLWIDSGRLRECKLILEKTEEERERIYRTADDWKRARKKLYDESADEAITILDCIVQKETGAIKAYASTDLFVAHTELGKPASALKSINVALEWYGDESNPVIERSLKQWFVQEYPEYS